ncbi:3-dehydroquinate synthase [Paenibacillus senegalensis]|uniref:3-dehydroquinate synthase n=1 Tax=Paenibacillus senegalensis TaxID=1465766 RepID=UPI000289ECF7|nr:3-dehydroquinate synthase [Paenibacillus senegalensis]
MKELLVDLGERTYPIYFGSGIMPHIGEAFVKHGIRQSSPVLVVSQEQIARHYLDGLKQSLEQAGYTVAVGLVPDGEASKSLAQLEELITICLQSGLDRNSTIVALGGGVVGDLAGFVAASFMRGVRFVQVPTTILAHDSSVGGKVAVNHRLAKNIIGAFHQPAFVYYDIDTLQTLPPREVRSGLAEVIKEGLIWDEAFVGWLNDNAAQLLALEPQALEYALFRGCQVKAAVVSEDEKENGLRAILNLGHTIGHALEAVAGYGELLHGEAISIGMVGSAKLAVRLGYPESILHTTRGLLQRFELPTAIPAHLDEERIMKSLMHDKKFKDGNMVFIIPTRIGQVEINKHISPDWVRETIRELKGEE